MADIADDLMIKPPVPIRHKIYDFLRNEILSNEIKNARSEFSEDV